MFFLLSLGACTTLENVFEGLTLSREGKERLLEKRVQQFADALSAQDMATALLLVKPLKRAELRPLLIERRDKEKLVEVEVLSFKPLDNTDLVSVHLRVKYFAVPEYIVKTREERQDWGYSLRDAQWLLERIDTLSRS